MLERWEQHGAIWRAISASETEAVVELRSCDGELVEALRFTDSETLRYLAARPRSDVGGAASAPKRPAGGEVTGKASFPASDPPASWTWEV